MGVIQVRLPDEVQAVIDRQVAEGRVADATEFLAEAARRFGRVRNQPLFLNGCLVGSCNSTRRGTRRGRC